MRNFTLLFSTLFCLFTLAAFGQSSIKKSAALNQSAIMDKTAYDGTEYLPFVENPHPVSVYRSAEELVVGKTFYDLQSNGTNQRRIVRNGDELSITWTTSEESSHANRGTGYNHFDGTDWLFSGSSISPTERLEETVRTGWPSITVNSNGDELIVCHGSPAPFVFHNLQKNSGATDWTESDVASMSAGGLLWPRSAQGSGSTVHAIAITTPVANGGVLSNGVDGQILYFRTQDNGSNWDKIDVVLPGLDSTRYLSNDADSYAIDARGDVVAIAIFGGFNDVVVYKSTDAGETWTEHIVNDFPLDLYVADQGYTTDDIPDDPNAPDSLAIFSSDGSGAVLIDNDDEVHVVFGNMYLADTDTTDALTQFFPATSGISYWNESHGEDSVRTIVDFFDANGNDTIDIETTDNIATYFQSLTTFPSLGIDDDGNIYMSYSGVMEEFFNTEDEQHYRHAFIAASEDGGTSWNEPVHLGTSEFFPDLPEFMEMVFTTIARDVDENIHLIMQRDFRPGLSVRGDTDPTELNDIVYLEVPANIALVSSVEEVPNEFRESFSIMPNPSRGYVTVDLTKATNVNLIVSDMLGRQVKSFENANGFFTIDLTDLEDGVYFVSGRFGKEMITKKVVLAR